MRRQNYILVFPSLFTTGNLFCGFYSIIRSYHHDFENAAWAILIAGIFDVLDGRVARLTHSTSQFGIEYDSISDVISFGVAPAVLSYLWLLNSYGRLGFAAAFFFTACGALRLARFNALANDPVPKSYFIGLPIPAAANLIAAYSLVAKEMIFFHSAKILLGLIFFVAVLMVSQVRYRSFKNLDTTRKRFVLLIFSVAILTAAVVKPELTLFALFGFYMVFDLLREVYLFFVSKVLGHKPKKETEVEYSSGG